MIRPIIHRQLTRGDLACLVDEIARMDVAHGREADQALQAGAVDAVLDSPAALEAVLGRGGALDLEAREHVLDRIERGRS